MENEQTATQLAHSYEVSRLRIDCLQLAHQHGLTADEVLSAAQKYFDFVQASPKPA